MQEGIVSSSNSLVYSDADMAQMLENDASVKEMEAAGISWAAHLFGTPFFAIKSITDIVDGDRPPQEEFLENLQRAAKALHVSQPLVIALLTARVKRHLLEACIHVVMKVVEYQNARSAILYQL